MTSKNQILEKLLKITKISELDGVQSFDEKSETIRICYGYVNK